MLSQFACMGDMVFKNHDSVFGGEDRCSASQPLAPLCTGPAQRFKPSFALFKFASRALGGVLTIHSGSVRIGARLEPPIHFSRL
jgi:hypothetical protein